jgi:hypothetical protein
MNTLEFDEVVEFRIQQIKEILQKKALEYASPIGDRLHNFNRAAQVTGKRREECLWGMAMKHFISIMDMIDKPETPTLYMVEEKLGDAINYLILLEASYKNKIKNERLD